MCGIICIGRLCHCEQLSFVALSSEERCKVKEGCESVSVKRVAKVFKWKSLYEK